MQGGLFDDHRPPEPDPRPTAEDLERVARTDVVKAGLDELAEGAELERPPAPPLGHVLLHAQFEGATDGDLRGIAEDLKARAVELGAVYAYPVVQPARPPR